MMKQSVLWVLLLVAPLAHARNDMLKPCPDSPNCVSSLATDEEHRVEPLAFAGDAQAAWARLQSVISGMKRARLVSVTDDYLHAEFRSALFRFIDDVEFRLDVEKKRFDVRSASRKGYSDLGANRRRVEAIREAFAGAEGQ